MEASFGYWEERVPGRRDSQHAQKGGVHEAPAQDPLLLPWASWTPPSYYLDGKKIRERERERKIKNKLGFHSLQHRLHGMPFYGPNGPPNPTRNITRESNLTQTSSRANSITRALI